MPEPSAPYPTRASGGAVGYVLMAYPRASEPFITSEIYRLEQAGLRLRLYVVKPAEPGDRHPRHPVVDRIRVRPEYLPRTTSLSTTPFGSWLATNLRLFRPAFTHMLRRRPRGLARAIAAALAQAARARMAGCPTGHKTCLRELLLAMALADRLSRAPEVRHLHAHYAHGATTVAWLAALITGLSFSFTAHAKDLYCESLNPAGLLRRKLLAARFAVTCTETNRRYLRQIASQTPVHRVYHGLNADFSALLAKAPERPATDDAFRVLGVGRLVRKKGFDTFVEACAVLRKAEAPLEAIIAGSDGEHGDEVRRRISNLRLDGVIRLTGPLDQASLYEQYGRATAFCLPCRVLDDGDRDGIPNVLMEAMARGLPVITTPISGITELVSDGVNGLLVPPDDPQALAGALQRLRHDPALADRLANAARRTVQSRFDGEALAGRLAELFREAAG
jgi:glycosyltransferase involved in cell wall biosynthesis